MQAGRRDATHEHDREGGPGVAASARGEDGRARPSLTRRSLLAGSLAAGTVLLAGDARRARPTAATVDLDRVVTRASPYALGVGCSTYGDTPLTSPRQAAVEQRLDARTVRVPVGVRGGIVTSSAAGGPDRLDMTALVRRYRSWGFRVVAVLGGRTTDVDLRDGDTTRVLRALGVDGVQYTTPNEPDNAGATLATAVELGRRIHAEASALAPGTRVWGPTWATYDPAALRGFALAMGPERFGGASYHQYGMGTRSLSTDEALAATPRRGEEVLELRRWLGSQGLADAAQLDEYHLSWRYADGTPDSDGGWRDPETGLQSNRRFFTAVATVYVASVAGHVLQAGGSALPYATQNGALGLTCQPVPGGNPDGRDPNSPMPAFWGVAAWTGARVWPHFAGRFFHVSGPPGPAVETFAVDNEAGGYSLVLVNKSRTHAADHAVDVLGVRGGLLDVYRSSPGAPYDSPRRVATRRRFAGRVRVHLPAMSVSVVVLTEGR